jgi:hypothetical protein
MGIDLSEAALERAREVSIELDSLGVLHHTFDCREALGSISHVVQNGGYIHMGLYHKYGREPFLNLFKQHRDTIS